VLPGRDAHLKVELLAGEVILILIVLRADVFQLVRGLKTSQVGSCGQIGKPCATRQE